MFKYEVEKDKDTESTLRKVTLFKVISLSIGTSRFVAPMITFYVDIWKLSTQLSFAWFTDKKYNVTKVEGPSGDA